MRRSNGRDILLTMAETELCCLASMIALLSDRRPSMATSECESAKDAPDLEVYLTLSMCLQSPFRQAAARGQAVTRAGHAHTRCNSDEAVTATCAGENHRMPRWVSAQSKPSPMTSLISNCASQIYRYMTVQGDAQSTKLTCVSSPLQYTVNAKRVEVAVKKVVNGAAPSSLNTRSVCLYFAWEGRHAFQLCPLTIPFPVVHPRPVACSTPNLWSSSSSTRSWASRHRRRAKGRPSYEENAIVKLYRYCAIAQHSYIRTWLLGSPATGPDAQIARAIYV